MKMKKSFLAVLLSMLFMFSSFVPSISVYAVSLSDINDYFDVQDKFYQILKRETDISTTLEHQTNILNKMYDIMESDGYQGARSGEGLSSNGEVTIDSDGNVLLSVALRNAIRQAVQFEIDNRMGFDYAYSFGTAVFVNNFLDSEQYRKFIGFVSSHESLGICTVYYNSYDYITFYPTEYYDSFVFDSKSIYNIETKIYKDWNTVRYSELYKYNSTTQEYELFQSGTGNSDKKVTFISDLGASLVYNGYYYVVNQNSTQYIVYKSFNEMKLGTMGLQPYYVGNDFSTSTVSTTQTITDSMLNSSISYQDISNYVNNYYVTNQTYPSSQDTYNYINNYTGSGGGSGGDNGNGSDDNNGNIWDFLGSIGDFLGNLISSLGSVLSGILSLLTDVIDMFIGENGLPNVIGSLISYFMPFLPEWVPTLIGFSVVLALILGVIKLIRG